MQHLEFVGQPQQAFRVPNEEIATGIQAAIKFFDQPLLFRFVEIHHHVAAEDDVVALGKVFRLQVMEIEVDHFLERLLDGIAIADLIEVAQAEAVIHGAHLMLVVGAFLPRAQHGVAYVAGQDFHAPGWRNQRLG